MCCCFKVKKSHCFITMRLFIIYLEILKVNCSFVVEIWRKMINSIVKLLVDEAFNVDCSIKSGKEEYTQARYAYFYISNIYLPRSQHIITGYIRCKRGIMPYGLNTFKSFSFSSSIYKEKVRIIENQVSILLNKQLIRNMKRNKCICIRKPNDSEFDRIKVDYQYEYIVIDDADINERPFVIVFIADENYISLSLSKFNEYFKST